MFVSFKADFPMVVDGATPAGEELAEFIVEGLRKHGVGYVSGPDDREAWAYDIVMEYQGCTVDCILGAVDDGVRQWLITTEARRGLVDRVLGRSIRKQHLAFCERLHALLKEDSRFSEIRWYSPDAWDRDPDNDWSSSPSAIG